MVVVIMLGCTNSVHVKQVVLIRRHWRSVAQQLARQKLDAVGRGKGYSNCYPLLRQVITYQSTAKQAGISVQSAERSSELDRGSEFKSGLRFLKPSSPSLLPLDSAFVELVDLLPQCWRIISAIDFNQDHYKHQVPLQLPDTRAYASALEADELCDEEISSKEGDEDEDDMGDSLDDSHEDSGLDHEACFAQKMKRKKYRELYKRQVKIET